MRQKQSVCSFSSVIILSIYIFIFRSDNSLCYVMSYFCDKVNKTLKLNPKYKSCAEREYRKRTIFPANFYGYRINASCGYNSLYEFFKIYIFFIFFLVNKIASRTFLALDTTSVCIERPHSERKRNGESQRDGGGVSPQPQI